MTTTSRAVCGNRIGMKIKMDGATACYMTIGIGG